MPATPIIARGFSAAHSALVGALYLFLLYAPLQVLGAVVQGLQREVLLGPDRQPDATRMALYVAASFGSVVLTLAVFFLFPFLAGGILGRARDRLESPHQPPGPFGAYGRAFYGRLLANEGLFFLVMCAILLPVMCLTVGLAFQQMTQALNDLGSAVSPEGASQPPGPQQITRQILWNPLVLVVMGIASLLMSVVSMVYWVANSIVVSEQEGVLASWRQSLRFCRQNLSAVLVVWLFTVAVGALLSPLGLVGQLGIVKNLGVLVALALVDAAVIAYWGVLLAGLTMSLYLTCRQPSGQREAELPALAGAAATGWNGTRETEEGAGCT